MRSSREVTSSPPDEHTPARIAKPASQRDEKLGATGKDTQFLQSQHGSTQEMAEETAQKGALRNSMPVMNWAKQEVGDSEQRQSLRRS